MEFAEAFATYGPPLFPPYEGGGDGWRECCARMSINGRARPGAALSPLVSTLRLDSHQKTTESPQQQAEPALQVRYRAEPGNEDV
jgi:hypothetical protein